MKWVNIGIVVVIFGEEFGYCFCCMVGVYYDVVSYIGDVILCFYLFMCFFIVVNKIVQFNFCFVQCLFVGEDGVFNIDGEYFVWLNKSNGVLVILFISLYVIRQMNGDKLQCIIIGFFL